MKTPRRLHFAVGTSLLTASLAAGAAGCDKNQPESEPPHVNEGPEPDETDGLISNPAPEPEYGPASNPGPVDVPPDGAAEPEPGPASNPGPVDAPG